ncbi:MAG: M81 family metallopeptidase [Pseudomonadota bacterium]
MRPRIAIAGFQHETNTFAPVATGFADFEDGGGWPGLTRGADVLTTFRGLNIPLSGFLSAAEPKAELVPILWTSAEPAAQVSRDAFDRITGMILDGITAAGPLDGIYLDLHGAMVTENHDDGEVEILRRVRALVGTGMPIAVSLDLHANISPEFVGLADAITIYRTYPHLDMDATGARAWSLLKQVIETGKRPATAFRQSDHLLPLSAQCTEFGPVAALYHAVAECSGGTLLSADVALGFPLADIPDAGPSLVVHAEDTASAEACADELLAKLDEAVATADNALLGPREAVSQALALTQNGGCVVLADVQDNSGAGAMSDTTGLLAALVESEADRCLLGTLWDPEAANLAHSAGVGATIDLSLGGNHGPDGVGPFRCSAAVVALSDGLFTCTGEMQRDVLTDIGRTALLRISNGGGDVRIVVSTRRHQTIDQELFRHLGLEPADHRIVAVKSTVHFRADFAPMAKAVLMVEAPGYSTCRLSNLTYRKLRANAR